MESYLNKLANDQTNSDNDFVKFLNMYINTKETLIELIDVLRSKLKLENIDEYFEKMKFYFESYQIKRSDVLKTSHVFCNCGIYTEAPLCYWIQKNSELFETDVFFFHSLFSKINIDDDVSSDDEKLKLLNTVVTNYNYLLEEVSD